MKLGQMVRPMRPMKVGTFSGSSRGKHRGPLSRMRNRFIGHTSISGLLKGVGKQKMGSFSGSTRHGLVKHRIKM